MPRSAGEFRPETLVAVEAVKQAFGIARPGVAAHGITMKDDGRDLVTVRDVAVEDAIRRTVMDALDFSVVGEERGGEATADGAPYWLVDPICGTGRPWTIRSDSLVASATSGLHEELPDLLAR